MKNTQFISLRQCGFRIITYSITCILFLCSCEDFLGIGGRNKEDSKETAISEAVTVCDALARTGEKNLWITGYVVGGDLSGTKIKFEGPFKSTTCLAIASDSTCTVRDSCMSVQLPKGEIRDSLNLYDHPELFKKKIYIKGDIVSSYYGLHGIQNISKYFK